MKKMIYHLAACLLIISCKNESARKSEQVVLNSYETDWAAFQDAVINNKTFDWNGFVEIEGQLGEDYIYLFQNPEAIEKIKKTSYKDLYEATLYGEPVKQLTIGTFTEFSQPVGDVFYFKETDRGLKLIGFESL